MNILIRNLIGLEIEAREAKDNKTKIIIILYLGRQDYGCETVYRTVPSENREANKKYELAFYFKAAFRSD